MPLTVSPRRGFVTEKDKRRPSLVGRGSRITWKISQGSFVFTYNFAGEAEQRADLSDVATSLLDST